MANKYYYNKGFSDRPGDVKNSNLIYTGSVTVDGKYVVGDIPSNVFTSPMQRLGKTIGVPKPNLTPTDREENGVGGIKFETVTVFGDLEPEAQITLRSLDGYRVGKNIKSYDHFASPVFRPIIRISPEGFFEEDTSGVVNHYASLNSFGFGQSYKTVNEDYELIPFNDFGKLDPVKLITEGENLAYPIVYKGTNNIEHYTDPSHPASDGAIDVFDVRSYMTTMSPSDIHIHGIKGDYQGGGIEDVRAGSKKIDSKHEISGKRTHSTFLDSQEIAFSEYNFSAVGKTTNLANRKFAYPGFVTVEKETMSPFSEENTYGENNSTDSFLLGKIDNVSEIGTRFKSATNGLIFGESNPLGTDSIAFGGLKK